MENAIIEMTSTASLAIAVFGIALCMMQTKYIRVNRSIAWFLAAVGMSNLPDAFARPFAQIDQNITQAADLILWFPSTLCLAPLFWIYVYTVTSPDEGQPKHLYRHFLLPSVALLFGLVVVASSGDILTVLNTNPELPFSGRALALVLVLSLLQLSVFPQIGIYLFLIVRRMIRFRAKLRDVYASTEQHELRWIVVIGGLGLLYWGIGLVLLFIPAKPEGTGLQTALFGIGGIAAFVLVGAIVLWGIRQRPPLVPELNDEPASHPAPGRAPEPEPKGGKYEKSALSPAAAARIAQKLRAAMEHDNLHRDANLSLWGLARHTGASPNYISQTLNEVIGESFFDFVNGYRIAEAMTLLSTTNVSVLTITYDVGFNARSSFYNAFKRVTGQTPTNYRKTVSFPAGMDDATK